ncbi:MAG: sulfotransferase, partial [Candidatus Aminicenantes bacterium]|nr:sulfotransferase [Candidatus Aminicenantes bacterium]
ESSKKFWPDSYNKNGLWGWKDPRNTITLNIWREFFPDAKVIHIYRNPVDVAASMMNREKRFTKNGRLKWHYNVLKYYIKWGVVAKRDPALMDIFRGIKLWEFYVKRAFLFKDNIIHIKYEDLLGNPTDVLSGVFDFLSIEKDRIHIELITNSIDKKRKYAFLSEKDLIDVYKSIKENEFIKLLGYNNIL